MWIGMQKELSFEEKLLTAGYAPDQGCFYKQLGPLLLKWWVHGNLVVDVLEITPHDGNRTIAILTFYGFLDETVEKIEAAILEMYKTLHGALPREE